MFFLHNVNAAGRGQGEGQDREFVGLLHVEYLIVLRGIKTDLPGAVAGCAADRANAPRNSRFAPYGARMNPYCKPT